MKICHRCYSLNSLICVSLYLGRDFDFLDTGSLQEHALARNLNVCLKQVESERTSKALTRLRSCTGWSALLFFSSNKVKFSGVVAHIYIFLLVGDVTKKL